MKANHLLNNKDYIIKVKKISNGLNTNIEYIQHKNTGEVVAKRCTICGEFYFMNGFYDYKQGSFGKTAKCKECTRLGKSKKDSNINENKNVEEIKNYRFGERLLNEINKEFEKMAERYETEIIKIKEHYEKEISKLKDEINQLITIIQDTSNNDEKESNSSDSRELLIKQVKRIAVYFNINPREIYNLVYEHINKKFSVRVQDRKGKGGIIDKLKPSEIEEGLKFTTEQLKILGLVK
jgi:archaellum component FlaG (FlaF/FlaG flagellin family)